MPSQFARVQFAGDAGQVFSSEALEVFERKALAANAINGILISVRQRFEESMLLGWVELTQQLDDRVQRIATAIANTPMINELAAQCLLYTCENFVLHAICTQHAIDDVRGKCLVELRQYVGRLRSIQAGEHNRRGLRVFVLEVARQTCGIDAVEF